MFVISLSFLDKFRASVLFSKKNEELIFRVCVFCKKKKKGIALLFKGDNIIALFCVWIYTCIVFSSINCIGMAQFGRS